MQGKKSVFGEKKATNRTAKKEAELRLFLGFLQHMNRLGRAQEEAIGKREGEDGERKRQGLA